MEKSIIKNYLEYAKSNNIKILIRTSKEKNMNVKIAQCDDELITYYFANSENLSHIKLDNIVSCSFKNKDDEKSFQYFLLEKKFQVKDLRVIVKNFENYYMEIIKQLISKEETMSKGYQNLKNKEKIYPQIFENLYLDRDNLLFHYFAGENPTYKTLEEILDNYKREVLLVEQANQSQKIALENAFNETLSIIEGPPGTGKTTTILNILANIVYQNKKVLIVSKNNSAIENVYDELKKMDIPQCYIRMGNTDIMKNQVEPNVIEKLEKLKTDIQGSVSEESELKKKLLETIEELNKKEKELDKLVEEKNILQELKNQLRHIEKTNQAHETEKYEKEYMKNFKAMSSEKLRRRINKLAKILVFLEEKNRIKLLDKIRSQILFKLSKQQLIEEGIPLHLLLEKYYLEKIIEEKTLKLEKGDFDLLAKQIKNLYKEEYIPLSTKLLKYSIKKNLPSKQIEQILQKVYPLKEEISTEENPTPIVSTCKNMLLELYPIVLTTVDSVISNYATYFEKAKKVDYIIIDEASQCDILSALPLLYLAKNMIVVGDKKQLSAIVNLNASELQVKVGKEYDYCKENFLSTIEKTMKPKSKMLLEHYRCDYNIINYCNKFFYNGELKIYKEAKMGAISLINSDKGKYVELGEDGYYNKREIKTIDAKIEGNIQDKFIITPFRRTIKYVEKQICRR